MGLVTVIAAQWLYGGVVLFLAAGVFLLVSSYYEAVLKEGGPDRDRVLDRLARGGGPRAFYIDQMSGLLDRVDVCAPIAVLYPFASLVATWLVVGDSGPIGDLIGFGRSARSLGSPRKNAPLCDLTPLLMPAGCRHWHKSNLKAIFA